MGSCDIGKGMHTSSVLSLDPLLVNLLNACEVTELVAARAASRVWEKASHTASGAWAHACLIRFPAMAQAVLAELEPLNCEQSIVPHSTPDDPAWCSLYLARCGKQRQWASRKEEERARKTARAARLQEEKQGPESAVKHAIGPEGRNNRSRQVREKTCKRCGARFLPALQAADNNATQHCAWHPGRLQHLDENGIAVPDNGAGQAMQRQIQEQVRRNNASGSRSKAEKSRCHKLEMELAMRTSNSKKASSFLRPGRNLEEQFQWSCCGANSLMAPGCQRGTHT
mmetsp:Transcript_24590/g.47888  ORF Transcript_24590/g.47888 Transcript_24590/m.47888 type:complete len:284 (+) Transcript_24590:92-943(+)